MIWAGFRRLGFARTSRASNTNHYRPYQLHFPQIRALDSSDENQGRYLCLQSRLCSCSKLRWHGYWNWWKWLREWFCLPWTVVQKQRILITEINFKKLKTTMIFSKKQNEMKSQISSAWFSKAGYHSWCCIFAPPQSSAQSAPPPRVGTSKWFISFNIT